MRDQIDRVIVLALVILSVDISLALDECAATFDCSTLHADAFGDDTKCYFPDLSSTHTWWQTKTYCNQPSHGGYDQWSIINPRNAAEDGLLKTKASQLNVGWWWVGQNDQTAEHVYKNHDDPPECPGVFLDWQIDSNEPNGGTNVDCIAINSKTLNRDAFNDRNCENYEFGVLCKAISSDFADEVTTNDCESHQPLGMESRAIEDSAISASSNYGGTYKGKEARLNNDRSWAQKDKDNDMYVRVTLAETTTIKGIQIQGSAVDNKEWVETFKVRYKRTTNNSPTVLSENGSEKVFTASSDANTVNTILFPEPIEAQVIAIRPQKCKTWCALRMELLGCPKATTTTKCKALHANAVQNTAVDSNSCYITRDDIEGNADGLMFQAAVDYCSNLGLGGYTWRVPDILNNEEAEFLRGEKADGGAELPFDSHSSFFWTGQNDKAGENQWTYLNQPANCPPVFLSWLPGEPNDEDQSSNENCIAIAMINGNWGYVDIQCSSSDLRAMCEMTIPDSAFLLPLEVNLEMLPYDNSVGSLVFQCTVRVSNIINTATVWRWRNMVTDPASTSQLSNGDVTITTEGETECRRTSRLVVPDFSNSEFEYGAIMCEAGGQTRDIVIEQGTIKSLSSWFDSKEMQLRLTCTVTGNPKPEIRWTFGTDTHIVASQGKFIISNSNEISSTLIVMDYNSDTDDGYYTCSAVVADRSLDQERISAVQPKITSLTKEFTDGGYKVTCIAVASPSILLSWDSSVAPTGEESYTKTLMTVNEKEFYEIQTSVMIDVQMDEKSDVCCIAKDTLTTTTFKQECTVLGCECRTSANSNYAHYHSGSCYRYSANVEELTWQQSESKCSGETSHLVHIESHTEQAFLESMVTLSGFWMGLKKTSASSPYPKWESGSIMPTYTNFFRDPSLDTSYTCYKFQYSNLGTWRIEWCSKPTPYMCEKEVVKISSSLQSGSPEHGQDVTLNCQAIGACANVGITWQHRSFSTSGQVTTRNLPGTTTSQNGNTQNSVLTITSYDDNDEGIYNCMVNLNDETIVSPDTLVMSAQIVTTSISYDAKGNMYILECSAKGNPAPAITWANNGIVVADDGVTTRISSSVTQESLSPTVISSTLKISGFQYDAHQSTTYLCMIDLNGNVIETQSLMARYPPVVVPCDDVFDEKCYVAVNDPVTWETAENTCKHNYGGHLVSAGTPEEQAFITALIQSRLGDYGLSHLWQGLKRNTPTVGNLVNDPWYTVDGSSLSPGLWSVGEPSTSDEFDCGAIMVTSTLHAARSCNDSYGYICKYNEHGVQIFKTESSFSFNQETGTFTMRCQAIGSLPPNITWTRNDQSVRISDTYRITTTTNEKGVTDSSLVLSEFQQDVGADIRCLAMATPDVIGDAETFAVQCPWSGDRCKHYLSDTNMCYAAMTETSNWEIANTRCSYLYDGHLTDVENEAEFKHIKILAKKIGDGQSAWLGIRHETGGWRTSEGELQTFFDWPSAGVHNNPCVALEVSSGKFIDVPCADPQAGYICKYHDKESSVIIVPGTLPIIFGNKVKVKCTIRQACVRSFQYSFKAFNSDNLIEISPYIWSDFNNGTHKSRVTIEHFSESDEGTYTCYANLTTGIQKQMAIDVATVTANIAGVDCDKSHNTTTVICEASSHVNPVIKWYTADTLINPDTSEFTLSETTNGTTLTSRLTMWTSQSHMFFCVATLLNAEGSDEDCLHVTSHSCERACREDGTTPSDTASYDYDYLWPRIPIDVTAFEFQVRANGDAHIALASDQADSTIITEIVFGGWGNAESAMRQCKQTCAEDPKVDTPNILSANEFRRFYIEFKGGLVQVGVVSEAPFMSQQYNSNAEINYVGISTGPNNWGTTGTWKFCDYSYSTLTTTQPTTTATTTLPTTTSLPTTSVTTTLPTTTVTTPLQTTTKATTTIASTKSTATTIPTTKQTTTTATTPVLTTTPTTTTIPTTTEYKTTTENLCYKVHGINDLEQRVHGNLCVTHIQFLGSTNKAVQQEIDEGKFTADKIDDVFNYVRDAPILEDGDIEAVATASQEAAHLCSTLLDVPLADANNVDEMDAMASKIHTLTKTEELLHEYSHKIPKGNCLNAKGPGRNKLSSDFCNVNSPSVLKYFEFREKSSQSTDQYEDKFSVDWAGMPEMSGDADSYFVASHARIDPFLSTTTAQTKKRRNNDDDVQLLLNSDSITFTMWYNNSKVSVPCYITLQHKESVDTRIPSAEDDVPAGTLIKESLCVYWDVEAGNWSTYGCDKLASESSAFHTSCYCNHSTSFAVLMQVTPYKISKTDEIALNWITYIGCGTSLFVLFITTYIYFHLRMFLWSERIFIHQNLILAIILAQCLFLGGIDQTQNEKTCKVVAVLLHLSYLAVFSWMLVEGFHLYSKVVRVFGTENTQLTPYLIIGWGVPLIITGISFGAGYDGYGSKMSCWLDTSSGLIWAFVAPALFVVLVNLIILGLVVRIIIRSSRLQPDIADQFAQIKAGLKGALLLLPILGATWLLGLLAVNNDTILFAYLFTLFNSCQGIFIFLVYCAFNAEVRAAWRKKKARDESIKIATTTVPEGGTLTEHGTVIFKFAADPETKTSSSISPSPTPSNSSKSNKFTGIIDDKMEKGNNPEAVKENEEMPPEDAEYDEYDDGPVDDIMMVDEELKRNESAILRRSPLDVDDVSMHAKSRMASARSQNAVTPLPGVVG